MVKKTTKKVTKKVAKKVAKKAPTKKVVKKAAPKVKKQISKRELKSAQDFLATASKLEKNINSLRKNGFVVRKNLSDELQKVAIQIKKGIK